MKHTPLIPLVFTLLAALCFSACGAGQAASPTPVPSNTPAATFTTAPTSTRTPTDTPVPTVTITPSAASTMPLNCDDWALIDVAGYQAQNNTWGKGDLTGWSQCIGLQAAEDGSIMARWTWDWLNSGGNVKAYPEISFGQKPGGPSTSPDLPLKVNQVGSAKVTYDVYSANDSGGNLAFDIWLTDTDNPDTFDSPPITHEIMVWLDSFGGLGPGGKFKERATIGGVEYNVFVAYNWGSGWTYVAFDRVKHQLGSGTLEMADFLEYMMANDLATGEEYMASIEFGNEVTHGTGETILNQYFISVQPK